MKLRWDDFVLDLDAYRLERGGVPLTLEPKAFNLLTLLVQRPGHVFTKQQLFDAVWPQTVVTDHALTRVVAQLRRVLQDEARDARYIETVPTRGYRWLPAVDRVPLPDAPSIPVAAEAPPAAAAAVGWSSARAAVLGVLVLLAAASLWLPRATTTATGARLADLSLPVQVTTHPGLDMTPALSPAGDVVAYASDRSGRFELYVRTLADAASESGLTADGGHNVQPAWSPDGRQIAFHSVARGGVWIISARGGSARQIAAEGSHPAWSPDGTRIAFTSDEHTDVVPSAFGAQSGATLWVVGADGRNPREVTRSGGPLGGHAGPVWSADGTRLLFTVFDGPDVGVWTVALATGHSSVVQRGGGFYELALSPDQRALYAAGDDATIVRVPLDPATLRAIGPRQVLPVAGVAGVRGLSISADGGRLSFTGLSSSSHIWAQAVTADGTPRGVPRAITTDTSRRNLLPALSPDGSRVAYVSRRGGEPSALWVIGVDGSDALQVTAGQRSSNAPHWFPDGRRLAFATSRDAHPALWQVDLTTRRELPFLDDSRRGEDSPVHVPLWDLSISPSMRHVVAGVVRPPRSQRQLFVAALDRVTWTPLTDGTEWIGYPVWSPDERRLAVELKQGASTHAAVVDVETGAVRQLTRDRGQTWVRSWSPDGRRIAAAVQRGGRWSLQWIDAATGATGEIVPPLPPRLYMRYPAWSPRGDLIVYEHGELRGNVWTLTLDPRPTVADRPPRR